MGVGVARLLLGLKTLSVILFKLEFLRVTKTRLIKMYKENRCIRVQLPDTHLLTQNIISLVKR